MVVAPRVMSAHSHAESESRKGWVMQHGHVLERKSHANDAHAGIGHAPFSYPSKNILKMSPSARTGHTSFFLFFLEKTTSAPETLNRVRLEGTRSS